MTPDFRKLLAASAVSNIGDGVTAAAGPLMIAARTADLAPIAGAAFAQQLPWLLLSALSGVVVDRVDRRRLTVAVNVVRAAILLTLVVAIHTDTLTMSVIYVLFCLLGTGETLADNAASAMLPSLVPDDQLPRANSWLGATFVVGNQFAAKPLGAWLFTVNVALPFGFDCATFAVAALLIGLLRWRPLPPPSTPEPFRSTDGAQLLWRDERLRLLGFCLCAMNIAFCAAFAVFVRYAADRLGLRGIGFGVLLITFAIGGLIGTTTAPGLHARFGPTALLRAGLLVELTTHCVVALSRSPWLVGGVLVLFGVEAVVWGVVVSTLRQRIVPDGLRGRVNGVYSLLDLGGAALGTLLGGLIAQRYGVLAPLWFAIVAMAGVITVVWRPMRRLT